MLTAPAVSVTGRGVRGIETELKEGMGREGMHSALLCTLPFLSLGYTDNLIRSVITQKVVITDTVHYTFKSPVKMTIFPDTSHDISPRICQLKGHLCFAEPSHDSGFGIVWIELCQKTSRDWSQ